MTHPTPMTSRLADRAKWAFTTRHICRDHAVRLIPDVAAASAGDAVLGRVERIGWHKSLQLPEGRPSRLHPGDLIVLCCGARYAADQFEGLAELDPAGADLLAGGGVLGRMRVQHERLTRPTQVIPLGLLADRSGAVLNTARFAMKPASRPKSVTAIAVIGSAMNSGKTTTTASLVQGLARAGRRVAAIKGTGTGAFGDINAYRDAGAHAALDFTDAGMVSTYREPHIRILAAIETLLEAAARADCDVAVVELADGVLQAETAALLADPRSRKAFAGYVYATPDPLSAVGGLAVLGRVGITPALVTGLISRSPLAVAEAEAETGIRVLGCEALQDPAQAIVLLHRLEARQRAAA